MPDLWLPPEDRLALWEPVADQVRVIGWRPGPAGVSTIELADGLTVGVDHASPTTLTEVAVDLADGRVADEHLPLLVDLLGDEATDRLRRLARSQAGTRPTELPASRERRDRTAVATTFARVTLAADLGDDASLSDGARAVAWLEAAAGAVDLDVRALAPNLVARSLDLLENTSLLSFDPKLAARVAAVAGAVERAAGDVLGARLRRATDRMTAAGRTARPAAGRRRARALESIDALALPTVAAMAAPLAAPAERARPQAGVTPLEVDGDHAAWAGLTAAGHVHVTAGHRAEGTWARVFRRADRLLLGLSPLRPSARRGQPEAIVVIPTTDPAELVVDVVTDPAIPRRRPTHDDVRQAVLAGRAAARFTRRRDPEADAAWAVTAARWHALGDVQRANLAERHGHRDDRVRRGSARLLDVPSLLTDEVP